MDKETRINDIKEKVKKYSEDRDWDQFHSAKELATALIIESAELLEHFRFKSEKEVEDLFRDSEKKEKIEDEMADVLFFLIRLAQRYDVDISKIFERKMEENERKYPIKKAKGSNKKYSEY